MSGSLLLPSVARARIELKEVFSVDPRALNESGGGAIVPLPIGRNGIQRYRVRCKVQHCNIINKNHRRYWADKTWARHTRPDSRFMRSVKARRVIGHLEHPESGRSNVKLGAIGITSVEPPLETGEVYGTFETMSTPDGIIVARYIEDGFGFGLSSRGQGSIIVAPDGVDDVAEDFEPQSFDVVADESTPAAAVEADLMATLRESARRSGQLLIESAGGKIALAVELARCASEHACAMDLGEADSMPPQGYNQFLLATPDQAGHYRAYQNGSAQWDVWFQAHNLAPIEVAQSMPTIKDAKAAAEAHLRWHVGGGAEGADAGGTVPPLPLATPPTAPSYAGAAGSTTVQAPAGAQPIEIKVSVGESTMTKKKATRVESYEVADVDSYSGVVVYLDHFNDAEQAEEAADTLADAGFLVYTDGESVAVYTTIENPEQAVAHVQRVLNLNEILPEEPGEIEEHTGLRIVKHGQTVFARNLPRTALLPFESFAWLENGGVPGVEEFPEMDDPKMNPAVDLGEEEPPVMGGPLPYAEMGFAGGGGPAYEMGYEDTTELPSMGEPMGNEQTDTEFPMGALEQGNPSGGAFYEIDSPVPPSGDASPADKKDTTTEMGYLERTLRSHFEQSLRGMEARMGRIEQHNGISEASGYGSAPLMDDPEDLDLNLDREKAPDMNKADSTPVTNDVDSQVKTYMESARVHYAEALRLREAARKIKVAARESVTASTPTPGIAYFSKVNQMEDGKKTGELRIYFDENDKLVEMREFTNEGKLVRRAGNIAKRPKNEADKDDDKKDKKDEKKKKRNENVAAVTRKIAEAMAKGGDIKKVFEQASLMFPITTSGTVLGATGAAAPSRNEADKDDDKKDKKDEAEKDAKAKEDERKKKNEAEEKDKKDKDEKKKKNEADDKKDDKDKKKDEADKDDDDKKKKDEKIRFLQGQVGTLESEKKKLEGLLAEVAKQQKASQFESALTGLIKTHPALGSPRIRERLARNESVDALRDDAAALLGSIQEAAAAMTQHPAAPAATPNNGMTAPGRDKVSPTSVSSTTTGDAPRSPLSEDAARLLAGSSNLNESPAVGDTASRTVDYRRRRMQEQKGE